MTNQAGPRWLGINLSPTLPPPPALPPLTYAKQACLYIVYYNHCFCTSVRLGAEVILLMHQLFQDLLGGHWYAEVILPWQNKFWSISLYN